MAVDKFMSRIVAPDVDNEGLQVDNHAGIAAEVHQFTHGINSDPITLLAIVFSALIHDGKSLLFPCCLTALKWILL